jgi:SAM-dependent methyltransferase
VADALVLRADPHAGRRVLDVACGSGNVALVAARRYCEVTGLDLVPELVERARERARAERLDVRFLVGDAQALPFEDAEFDYVFSTFGVMFAPDQERAARELVRVCRPGGTIALASWRPEGVVSQFFGIVARHAPPTPGLEPPTRWGTESGLRALFDGTRATLLCEQRTVTEYMRSPEHAYDVFATHFGPTRRTIASLEGAPRREFCAELARFFRDHNQADDGSLAIALEYLETVLVLPAS